MPRKRAIIRTAQDLFSRYGYRGVTLREIAKEAGVSLTLVDHHFGTKFQLFEAIVQDWCAVVSQGLEPLQHLPRQASIDQGIHAVISTLLDYLDSLRASPEGLQLVWVNIRNRHDDDDAVRLAVRGLFSPIATAFVQAMHTQMPHVERSVLLSLYQYVRGALVEYLAQPEWGSSNEPRNQLTLFLVGGIRTALVTHHEI